MATEWRVEDKRKRDKEREKGKNSVMKNMFSGWRLWSVIRENVMERPMVFWVVVFFPNRRFAHTQKEKNNTKHYYKTTVCVDGQKISQCSISFFFVNKMLYLYSRGIIMAARAIKELKHTMIHAKRNETLEQPHLDLFYIQNNKNRCVATSKWPVFLNKFIQWKCLTVLSMSCNWWYQSHTKNNAGQFIFKI